jgi:hypothetical protein
VVLGRKGSEHPSDFLGETMTNKNIGVRVLGDEEQRCFICENDVIPTFSPNGHDMMLIMASGETQVWCDEDAPAFLGFKIQDGRFLCHLCWRLMIGFERPLSLSTNFSESARHPEISSLIRKIWTDVQLSDEAFENWSNYYSQKFVDRLRKMEEPTQWRKFMIVSENPDGATFRCGYPEDGEIPEEKSRDGGFQVFFIEGKNNAEESVMEWLREQGYSVQDHRRNGKADKGRSDFTASKDGKDIHVEAKNMKDSWHGHQALWAINSEAPYWLVFVYGDV